MPTSPAVRESLGLDKSMVAQFFIWLSNLAHGNLGESFYFKKTVVELIAQRIEPTLSLALLTIIFAIAIAVPLGVIAASKHGGWLDRMLMGMSVLGFSVPVFVIGYALIWCFSLWLGILPVQGYSRLENGVGKWLSHLILPALSLSLVYTALISRVTRAAVSEALTEDYVRTARAKGLSESLVLIRHALPNAAVPIVTVIGIGIALLIGGGRRHRNRFRPARTWATHGRRCDLAGLSGHPGRDPSFLGGVRARQSTHRSELSGPRSPHPVLIHDSNYISRNHSGRCGRSGAAQGASAVDPFHCMGQLVGAHRCDCRDHPVRRRNAGALARDGRPRCNRSGEREHTSWNARAVHRLFRQFDRSLFPHGRRQLRSRYVESRGLRCACFRW